VILCFGHTWGH